MENRHYDIVIVGAGPAGSTTAMYINPHESGKRVLLLEARREVGYPIQCGEAMPTYAELKNVFPDANCPELFDFPKQVIAGPIDGIKFIDPYGKSYVAWIKGQMLYRDRLDQWLFGEAVKRGAEYRLATRVERIEGQKVITSKGEYTADIIVGADGPRSIVSDSCGFEPNRDLCRCSFVIAEGDFYETLIELWFQKRFPGGYFWLFPKQGEANIGVGVRWQKNVRGLLDAMLEEIGRTKKFKIKMHGGGMVPLGGLKKKIMKDKVALVGDAAGMVFPSNGGGTGVAMLAGKILGEVIRKGEPLASYEAAVNRILRPVLNASLRQRRLMDLTRRSDALFAAVMWMANIKGWRSFIIG